MIRRLLTKKEIYMAVQVDKETCTGCGSCVDSCPVESLSMDDEVVIFDEDTCIDCGVCVD
jgi:ferredoxin